MDGSRGISATLFARLQSARHITAASDAYRHLWSGSERPGVAIRRIVDDFMSTLDGLPPPVARDPAPVARPHTLSTDSALHDDTVDRGSMRLIFESQARFTDLVTERTAAAGGPRPDPTGAERSARSSDPNAARATARAFGNPSRANRRWAPARRGRAPPRRGTACARSATSSSRPSRAST